MVFISHDLSVVRRISDDVAVMYFGSIVEPPVGCAFAARCPQAMPRCLHDSPALQARVMPALQRTALVACHLFESQG